MAQKLALLLGRTRGLIGLPTDSQKQVQCSTWLRTIHSDVQELIYNLIRNNPSPRSPPFLSYEPEVQNAPCQYLSSCRSWYCGPRLGTRYVGVARWEGSETWLPPGENGSLSVNKITRKISRYFWSIFRPTFDVNISEMGYPIYLKINVRRVASGDSLHFNF